MPNTNNKQKKFFEAVKRAKHDPTYGNITLHKVAESITDSDIKNFAESKADIKIKKAILSVLKDSKNSIDEIYDETDNIGDKNAITKEFNVEGKFDEYVKRFLGQRFSEKEMEAINTFQEVKPTKVESNLIRYETTDDFQNSNTTIIKKLREGSDFVYVAFTKNVKPETPEDQQQSDGDIGGGGIGEPMGGSPMMEDLGASDQPTPSNDMSIPTNPDFGSGFSPYSENKEYWKKIFPKNESKLHVSWPEKLNEQIPMDPMGASSPIGNQPPMGTTPPPSPISTGPATTTAPMTGTPKSNDQRKKEMGIDDIKIQKSNTFKDEIKGGAILAAFLKKLDL